MAATAARPAATRPAATRPAAIRAPRRARTVILASTLGVETLLAGTLAVALATGTDVDWLWALGWVAVAAVGGALAASRPRNPIGWILYAGGTGTLLAMVLGGIAALAGNAWLQLAALLLFGAAWLATTSLALVHFPDGRVEGRAMRALRAAVWVLVGVTAVGLVLDPIGFGDDAALASPLGIPALGAVPQAVANGAQLAGSLVTVAATVVLLARWRRAAGETRRRLGWIALAALAAAVLAVAMLAMTLSGVDAPDSIGAAFELVQVTLPVLIAVGVIDPRAFDVDVAVRVSLVAVVLTAAVITVFTLVMWGASQVFGSQSSPVAALVASGLVAVSLGPAKGWLDAAVQRRLFGARREPARAVTSTASAVAAAASPDESVAAAAELAGTTLRLGGIDLHATGGETVSWRAPGGIPAGSPSVERPLVALGGTHGAVVAYGRSRGDDGASLASGIDAVAPLLALVVGSARTAASLRAARERAAGAREDERRRVQRALHDGVGPTLVGVAMQLDAVRDRVDPESAEAVARAGVHLRDAIDGLRRAIDGLRPPELDHLGLAGALAERGLSLAAGGLDVRLECAGLPALPPAVEVATYLIASEAAANVAKHADATTCLITVAVVDGVLDVRVEDDGRGLARDGHDGRGLAHDGHDGREGREGVGMRSMRVRAEELGGRLAVSAGATGGTVVAAALPLVVGAA
ncbi:histidine kinase [Xylanimonas cellulosilytica DSM 15894]|uniref:histidine kinase n=1 Tax=Xylanimonas cellulosilytica (strain DSM 15894 / JCM 12276 / CECT 5975 / KCTC 9989 / LMG 20990 / NBRC 107835 / XIL07) TaxID=446471 RepID=D1BRQ9_XYLCX|nr:histidine kinase [Xylanimonas cellulosilytica]ACZ32325.1 histidine kinase [Xylanimonas cellulosilytica DSM 15894]